MALHATTIRFADRAYMAIARAADSQGISVSQYVREAALIRAVLDELDSAEEAVHTARGALPRGSSSSDADVFLAGHLGRGELVRGHLLAGTRLARLTAND